MQVLAVEQIPAFVANLSNTAVNLTTEISQSAATVQTIVEMLVKVADISQNVTIDENVMKVYSKMYANEVCIILNACLLFSFNVGLI